MAWDEEGNVSCVLAFGSRREDVYLHHNDLLGVFSPEAGVQFMRSDIGKEPKVPAESGTKQGDAKQVVSLNTYRKKREHG
jgi:hypothetical protein